MIHHHLGEYSWVTLFDLHRERVANPRKAKPEKGGDFVMEDFVKFFFQKARNLAGVKTVLPGKSSIARINKRFVFCHCTIYIYMGVSKNRGIPKWMVYNGKPY